MASDMTPPPPPPPSSAPPPPPPVAVPPPAAPPIDPPPEYLRQPRDPEAPLQTAVQATGGRGLGLVFLAVIALGVFGVVIWYAYEQGVRRGVQMAPPLIKADSRPVRIKPAAPGGMEVPHQDKTVYERLTGQTKPAEAEKLLPPPENVIEKPLAIVRDAVVSDAVGETPTSAASKAPPAKQTVEVETAKAAEPAPPAVPQPLEPQTKQPEAKPEVKQEPKPEAKKAVKPEPATMPAAKPAAKPTALVETKATAPITRATDYLIQIGAYRTPKAAQAGWKRLVSANKALLGSLKPIVVRVDLGTRGIYHRLRAGPVDGADAAKALCARLKQRKVGCLVIKP